MVTARPPTEQSNPRTESLDLVGTEQAIRMILREDQYAVAAALAVAGQIAELAERIAERLAAGGTLHYFGAGASGRLAVADATEATPTFGMAPGRIRAHFPGGAAALVDSTIDLEDAGEAGRSDAAQVTEADVVVGISASGTTSYVLGALQRSAERGARTALITCNLEGSSEVVVDDLIGLATGPEALTGSTRLKAGTATKVVLNALSTATMVKLGRTYGNQMVSLTATNAKLRTRSVSTLQEISGLSESDSVDLLEACGGELPVAVVAALTGTPPAGARAALTRTGSVRAAIASLVEQ